ATVTSNRQFAPVAKLALLIVRVEVPDIVDPAPQNPVEGKLVAANPESAVFKSSVKLIPVAESRLKSLLVMSKVNVADDPGDAALGKVR
ncbi:MAG: hypothetical protein MI864_28655, partial [Pseudomonadales bacterium]|nr:hypothetical protein [Pseudomonadales bacterium]